MFGEMSLTAGLVLIFAVFSFIISALTLLYLHKAVEKEHGHVRKIVANIWKLKTHLQEQMGKIEKNINEHIDRQRGWEQSVVRLINEKCAAQNEKNELAVGKVFAAVQAIATSREAMARGFGEFIRLCQEVAKTESDLLREAQKGSTISPPGTAKENDQPEG